MSSFGESAQIKRSSFLLPDPDKDSIMKRSREVSVTSILILSGLGKGQPLDKQIKYFTKRLKEKYHYQIINTVKDLVSQSTKSKSKSIPSIQYTYVMSSCEVLQTCIDYLERKKITGWKKATFISGARWFTHSLHNQPKLNSFAIQPATAAITAINTRTNSSKKQKSSSSSSSSSSSTSNTISFRELARHGGDLNYFNASPTTIIDWSDLNYLDFIATNKQDKYGNNGTGLCIYACQRPAYANNKNQELAAMFSHLMKYVKNGPSEQMIQTEGQTNTARLTAYARVRTVLRGFPVRITLRNVWMLTNVHFIATKSLLKIKEALNDEDGMRNGIPMCNKLLDFLLLSYNLRHTMLETINALEVDQLSCTKEVKDDRYIRVDITIRR